MVTASMTRGSDGNILIFNDYDFQDTTAARIGDSDQILVTEKVRRIIKDKSLYDLEKASRQPFVRFAAQFFRDELGFNHYHIPAVAVGSYSAVIKFRGAKVRFLNTGGIRVNGSLYRNQRLAKQKLLAMRRAG